MLTVGFFCSMRSARDLLRKKIAPYCDAMEENDSTEVQYKIRQWSLPGDTILYLY